MNTYEQYVHSLTDSERLTMIENFEEFEAKGAIGDEPLRKHAEILMARLGMSSAVVFAMQSLAFECFRYYAREYFAHQFGEHE